MQCSVKCGQGVRKRNVYCANLKGDRFNDSRCNAAEKLPETEPCIVPCVKWVPGHWGEVRIDRSFVAF